MADKIQHDPRTKQQIKDAIYSYVYTPVLQQLSRRLEAIIAKNCELQASNNASFNYKGVVYKSNSATLPLVRQKLSPLLVDMMENYLVEAKYLNEYELPFVLGFLTNVLNSSNELHDYLKVLPDSVHRPVKQLIDTCPCRMSALTQDNVLDLQIRNQVPINLLKQRLLINLLI